jgi:hypothetical protein
VFTAIPSQKAVGWSGRSRHEMLWGHQVLVRVLRNCLKEDFNVHGVDNNQTGHATVKQYRTVNDVIILSTIIQAHSIDIIVTKHNKV